MIGRPYLRSEAADSEEWPASLFFIFYFHLPLQNFDLINLRNGIVYVLSSRDSFACLV